MPITRNASGQVEWDSPSGREAWRLTGTPQPAAFQLTLQCFDRAHCVRAIIFASADFNSGWECGVFDDAGTLKLSIRRVISNTYEAFAGPRTANVTLPAGTPYTLRVTVRDNVITTDIYTASASQTVTHTNSTPPNFLSFAGVGVVSDVDNAVVATTSLQELVVEQVRAGNVLAIIANGGAFASFNRGAPAAFASGIVNSTGYVSLAEADGKVLVVGNGRFYELDVVNLTSTPVTANAGSLPGETQPGTTTATIVKYLNGRAHLAAGRELWVSAQDDIRDWDTGSTLEGRAFVLTFDEPIVGMEFSSLGTLVVSLVSKWQVVAGDAIIGSLSVRETGVDTGATGPQSLYRTLDGAMLVHASGGMVSIRNEGGSTNISAARLRGLVSVSEAEQGVRTFILSRDPRRNYTYLFRSRSDGTSTEHVVYDEVGDLFLVDTYPASMQPTAATTVGGDLVIGCRDGGVRYFKDSQTSDDGTAFTPFIFTAPIRTPDLIEGVRADWVHAVLSAASGPVKVETFAAQDVETVYNGAAELVYTGFVERGAQPSAVRVTGRVLAHKLTPFFSGTRMEIERVDGDNVPVRMRTFDTVEVAPLGSPCFPPGVTISVPTDPGTPGPGEPTPGGGGQPGQPGTEFDPEPNPQPGDQPQDIE